MSPRVAFLMGSDSDFPALEKGIDVLRQLQVEVDVEVSSAHRTPERTQEIVRAFEQNGVQVIIAAAGGLPPLIAGPEEFEEIRAVLRPVLEEASRRMHVAG